MTNIAAKNTPTIETTKFQDEEELAIVRSIFTDEENSLLDYVIEKTKEGYKQKVILDMYSKEKNIPANRVAHIWRVQSIGELRDLFHQIVGEEYSNQYQQRAPKHSPEKLRSAAISRIEENIKYSTISDMTGIHKSTLVHAVKREKNDRQIAKMLAEHRKNKNNSSTPIPQMQVAPQKASAPKGKDTASKSVGADIDTATKKTVRASEIINVVESVKDHMDIVIEKMHKDIVEYVKNSNTTLSSMSKELKKLSTVEDHMESGHTLSVDPSGLVNVVRKGSIRYDEDKINELLAYTESLEKKVEASIEGSTALQIRVSELENDLENAASLAATTKLNLVKKEREYNDLHETYSSTIKTNQDLKNRSFIERIFNS